MNTEPSADLCLPECRAANLSWADLRWSFVYDGWKIEAGQLVRMEK